MPSCFPCQRSASDCRSGKKVKRRSERQPMAKNRDKTRDKTRKATDRKKTKAKASARKVRAAAKPRKPAKAATRPSAEASLKELRRRLLEISDLNAAGSVLSWDQATYMPAGG